MSPDVNVVLCDSDFEVDGTYSGRSGLDRAINNLNDNFLGDLNVLFQDGDAVVIILVDKSEADNDDDDGDPDPTGATPVDHTMTALDAMRIDVYGANTMSPAETLAYLTKIGAKDISVSGGKWNFTLGGLPYSGVAITYQQVYKTGTVELAADAANAAAYPLSDFAVVKKGGDYAADDAVITYTVTYKGSSADTNDKIAIAVANADMDTAVPVADGTNDFSTTKTWDVKMSINAKDAGKTTVTVKVTAVA